MPQDREVSQGREKQPEKAGLRRCPPQAGNPRGKGAGVFIHQLLSLIVSRAGEGGARSPALLACHACGWFWKKMLVT